MRPRVSQGARDHGNRIIGGRFVKMPIPRLRPRAMGSVPGMWGVMALTLPAGFYEQSGLRADTGLWR